MTLSIKTGADRRQHREAVTSTSDMTEPATDRQDPVCKFSAFRRSYPGPNIRRLARAAAAAVTCAVNCRCHWA